MTITPELAQRMRKLSSKIVENLVSCDSADEEAEQQYLEWTLKTVSRFVKQELKAKDKQTAELREYYEGVIADGSKRIAELEARTEQQPVTDAMALAFHAALSDGSIGSDDVEEIKTGLRAALANYTTPPAPAPVTVKLPADAEHDVLAPVVAYFLDALNWDGGSIRWDGRREYDVLADRVRYALEMGFRRAAGIKIAEGE